MTQKMLINAVDSEEVRIAILNRGVLEEFDIEARGAQKHKGNIYKAVVTAVEPALNAAFVDYGAEKQGFLTANDVRPELAHGKGDDKVDRRDPKITALLKPKQSILVQVTKDEVGTKGAVLTTYLSLAGRYVVLMPNSSTQGVSRKISDEEARSRVRESVAKLAVPDNMGVIIRTAGQDRTKTELNRDLKYLLRLWDNIQRTASRAKAPAVIFKEQDVIIRALRDYFTIDTDEVILDSDEAFDQASDYMNMVMPRQRRVLTRYVERRPIFSHYRVEEQLEALYAPKVPLRSGGSLVIEPTEALVSIDVNSGKQKSSDQEGTALQTNLEAAAETARQLRLRDLGGIVVIDFIDMMQRKNQQKVERAVKEALKNDKARVNVGRISRNGTLEVTRQRIRTALQSRVFSSCPSCSGTGHILSPASHAIAVLRKLRDRAARGDLLAVRVGVEPEAANLLRTSKWPAIQEIQQRYDIRVDIVPDRALLPGHDEFKYTTNPDATVLPVEEPDFGPAPKLEGYDDEFVGSEEFDDEDDDAATDVAEGGSSGKKRRRRSKRDAADGDVVVQPAEAQRRAPTLDGGKHDGRGERHATRGQRGRSEALPTLPPVEELLADLELGHVDFALPSFEFVDLSALNGNGHRTRPRRDRDVSADAVASVHQPIREDSPSTGTKPRHTPVAIAAPTEKTSLLRRLLNWSKRL